MDISVVVPLFNEEESLPELVRWIKRVMDRKNYSYEVILVDDGSNDSSWEVIRRLHKENPAVRGIKFRRNYGKSAALYCGFEAAQGEVVITMDADLQDSPNEIPDLVRMIREEKYDMVSGWKKKRFDPLTKTLPSKLFNGTARLASGIKLHDFNCGLKAYRKSVVKSIEVYGEMHRYIPILAKHAGFTRIGEKVVQHQPRKYGTTKFGIERFINGYLDLLSVTFISRFAKKPMHFFGLLGTFVFLFGFIAAIVVGANKLTMLARGIRAPLVADNPWFYIALVAMIIGTMLFLTGFIAELISRSAPERNIYQIETRTEEADTTREAGVGPEPDARKASGQKQATGQKQGFSGQLSVPKQATAAPLTGTSSDNDMPGPERLSSYREPAAPVTALSPEIQNAEPERTSAPQATPGGTAKPGMGTPAGSAPVAENPAREMAPERVRLVWEKPAVTERVPPEPVDEVKETPPPAPAKADVEEPALSDDVLFGSTKVKFAFKRATGQEEVPAEQEQAATSQENAVTGQEEVPIRQEEMPASQEQATTSQEEVPAGQEQADESISAGKEQEGKPRKVVRLSKKQKSQDNTLF